MIPTILVSIVIVSIVIVVLAGGFFLYVYWWLIQRPAPRLDGVVHLDLLDAEVEILYDKHAVPHLYASSAADMFRAQGYLHAQNRLWQMEQSRRTASGSLAEIFGEAALDADRFSRIIGFHRAAKEEWELADEETRRVLTWYTEGVNTFLEREKGTLAAEFNLLRFLPEPWTPLDCVAIGKVMNWALSINWESELTRLRLFERLGTIGASDLEPDYAEQNPVTLEGVGATQLARLLVTAGLLLNEYEEVKKWLGILGEIHGSNAWVLAPKHSLTGRPLLCNDPHLQVQIPCLWYEVHLASPDYNVSGVSLPGIPGVLIGHNENIAWGMTNGQVDVQDLYVERMHPDNPSVYAYEDEWEQAETFEERITVRRWAQPHTENVVVTRHGPIISSFVHVEGFTSLDDTSALALRWTGHAPGATLRAILNLNRARDWGEFRGALDDWAGPAQNVVFADARGNIGYVLAGDIPLRTNNLGLVPAPGWDGEHEWEGMIPRDQLPQLYNPPSGKIVTANNKMTGDDYPYFMGVEFLPGWRAARIEEMLCDKDRYSIGDMARVQQDTLSCYAAELTPWLISLDSDDPWEKMALGHLRKWNYRMDADNTAALIFHYVLQRLLELVFGDKLSSAYEGYLGISQSPLFLMHGFMLRATTRLVELLNNHETSFWYSEVSSGQERTREQLLHTVLSEAVERIRNDMGDSALRWDWGRTHQIRFVHPMGSIRLFRSVFNRGPIPVSGDATTPNLTAHAPVSPPGLVQVAASYRQIYEVGVWENAQSVLATGQSGHPLSEHYDDQIALWREGQYHKMPWSRQDVEEQTAFRMYLRPISSSQSESNPEG